MKEQFKKEETVTAKSFSRWSGNIADTHYELVSYFKGKVESFQAGQLIKSQKLNRFGNSKLLKRRLLFPLLLRRQSLSLLYSQFLNLMIDFEPQETEYLCKIFPF